MATKAAAADADDEKIGGEGEGGAGVEVNPGKKLPGKKLVLFIGAPVLLLIVVGTGLWMFGIFGGGEPTDTEAAQAEAEAAAELAPNSFFDLPDMLVNLNADGKKQAFLKIKVSLELADEEAVKHVEAVLPRLVDNFQVYLRELRPEDLKGSAGLHRLREELLLRANEATKPVTVKDVLFREMLVQ